MRGRRDSVKIPRMCSRRFIYFAVFLFAAGLLSAAQQPPVAASQRDSASSSAELAERAFKAGNGFMERHNYSEALRCYEESLAIEPNDTSVLFNAGMAAYFSNNFPRAAELWKRLVDLDPGDWRARSKLIQVYQALDKTAERDAQRAELLELWKSGKDKDMLEQGEYCRDQFEMNGAKVMVFEHFELKGDRAVRYAFIVLGPDGKSEDHRYSLGSYESTNEVWRESTKPKPGKGERLFHLDGYFQNAHATYAMMIGEPSYDETRAMVVKIIQGELKPESSTTWNPAPQSKKPQ